ARSRARWLRRRNHRTWDNRLCRSSLTRLVVAGEPGRRRLEGVGRERIDEGHVVVAELIADPGALSLRVLPGVDDRTLDGVLAGDASFHQIANGSISRGVPGGCVGRDALDQRGDLRLPPGREHLEHTRLDPP